MKNKKSRWLLIFAVMFLVLLLALVGSVYAVNGGRRGDATGDGVVDLGDVIALRQYLANYDYESGVPLREINKLADFNKDGTVDLSDLVALRKYLVTVDSSYVEITENNGTASVLGVNGLEYTATGYSTVENGKFLINSGYEITLDDDIFAESFNRLSFEYESTEPLKVFITYTLNGEEKTDYFFLEAGKTSFRGLIEGYIYGNVGSSLKKLTVNTCEEVDALFVLHGLETEQIPVYDDDLTVENDRYKIGVRLSWGGAMTYFEDKLDGDDELANLVNIHDTGRLIQQSFYGTYTNNDGYVSVPNGGEGASLWPYNPVQGGDRFNQGSDRLIDVEYNEEEDYIYIVSQSLDWAYNKGLTYTYYENTYTIVEGNDEGTADDYVLVDNVMTEFSGWEHPAGGQEIPAVYLVSYFDTLSFYNGIKPWTGDDEGVYYESELQGWSNAGIFPLYKGNTETWSIWINTDDGFGFGTYCPNIQKHIAIRHQYNGSKDPMNNATSYVAPSCSIVMQSYKPIEYSSILATGAPEDIRAIFEENKDFTGNPSLSENRYDQLLTYGKFDMMNMDFTVAENADIFYAPKHIDIGYDASEKALKFTIIDGRDPYASINFDWNSDKVINSGDFNTIEIEYMLPVTNSKSSSNLVLFLSAGENNDFNENYTVGGTLVCDGEYHTLRIRVPKGKIEGDMHKLRFDPFTSAANGDVMYIKSISLTTLEYPELSTDNDMSIEGSENLPVSKAYTDTYIDKNENALALMAIGGTDVSITLDFSGLYLSTLEYTGVIIEYMIPETNALSKYSSSIYYSTSDHPGIVGDRVVSSGTLVADGQYHTMTFNFAGKAQWTGEIASLRFDYFQNAPVDGDVMYVKRITFIKAPQFEIDISGEDDGKHFYSVDYTDVYYDEAEGALLLCVNGGTDVKAIMNLSLESLSTAEYTKMFVRYMIPVTNSCEKYGSTVYFTTDESGSYTEDKAIYLYGGLIADGNYHTAVFDLSQKETWTGNIAKLRFDYFQGTCADGDVIYIEYIALG